MRNCSHHHTEFASWTDLVQGCRLSSKCHWSVSIRVSVCVCVCPSNRFGTPQSIVAHAQHIPSFPPPPRPTAKSRLSCNVSLFSSLNHKIYLSLPSVCQNMHVLCTVCSCVAYIACACVMSQQRIISCRMRCRVAAQHRLHLTFNIAQRIRIGCMHLCH